MTDNCKHKAAAASINWFADLLKGKGGHDRKEALSALSSMLASMKKDNCDPCQSRADCHDLDKAMKAISECDAPSFVAEDGPVGPLLIKKAHARKMRLIRPHGR